MLVNFRQGIISAQTDQLYLNFSGNKININANQKSVDITFAYGSADYLFSEAENVTGAWGPFSSSVNYWIYWDIDLKTGLRTFGSTTIQPSSGSVLPTNPNINQHFFDLVSKKMRVWNGLSWEDKLRVFAAEINGGSTITPYNFGSQVGLSGNYSIGYILFDSVGNPLTRNDNGISYFITTEDKVHTQYDNKNAYKIDGLLADGVAMEPIPAYHCLGWKGPRQLGVTSYALYQYPCIGISVEPSGTNDLNQFVTKGFLTNYNNWNWTVPAGTPLFVGLNGEITTEVPQKYSLQKIGHIVAPDTIFVDIQEIILLQDVGTIVPPSPSPSLTITPTLTATPSPTITPTLTKTPSVSSSLQISPTPTPSITVSTSPTVTNNGLYVSLFYDNNGVNNMTLSSFSNNKRNDIGVMPMVWDNPQEQLIDYKFTRKLHGYSYVPEFITVNMPSNVDWTAPAYTRLSGIVDGPSFGMDGTIFKPITTETRPDEGIPFDYGYAIDTASGFEINLFKYANTGDIYTDLLVFKNGVQYTVGTIDMSLIPSYVEVAMSGIDILDDGSFYSTGYVYTEDDPSTHILTIIIFNIFNIDDDALTVDVKLTPFNANAEQTYPDHIDNDGSRDSNPEIYETKPYNGYNYISMANQVPINRQSIDNSLATDLISNVPYLIVYNSNTNTPLTYYNSDDYGYYTITDNYMFTINHINGSDIFTGNLVVNSIAIDNDTIEITTEASLSVTKTLMPVTDGRLRSVKSDDDNILIFTFGNGVYNYNISTNMLTIIENESGVYQDMDLIQTTSGSEEDEYNNIVIDTWVGSLVNVKPLPPTPSPTPSPTLTPTITPASSLLTDTYSPVILADNPTHYWAMRDTFTDNTGTISLNNIGNALFVRDNYGYTIQNSSTTTNLSCAKLSSAVTISTGTFEAWVMITDLDNSSYQTIFGDARSSYYGLQFDGTGELYLYNGNSDILLVNSGIITTNQMYHIVVVINSDNTVVTYVNGTPYTPSNNQTISVTWNIDLIGNDGDQEILTGTIGNPAIYLFALTQEQVTAHYNAGITNYRY